MPKYLDKVPEVPSIIPMCLYHKTDEHTGEYLSYIGNPMIVRTSKGKITFECIPHGLNNPYEGWTLKQRFYVINPMYRPIPSYTSLMCAVQRDAFPFNTTDVYQMYDPFNIKGQCINFITWMEPTPYTAPLFIYKSGDGVFVTFEEEKDMERKKLSPIYVLLEHPTKNTILLEDNKDWFQSKDGVPDFRFRQYMGRCSPWPGGMPLEKCVVANSIGLVKPMSLISYLQQMEKQQKDHKATVPKLFERSSVFVISLILIVFLIALFATLWILFPKNEKSGRYGKIS